ncbi:MAG: hypothetical protein CL914_13875 [Deltaproteobacteria bacterium]|nr:hypothetical protein [Deltaproteobacteria bacterium]
MQELSKKLQNKTLPLCVPPESAPATEWASLSEISWGRTAKKNKTGHPRFHNQMETEKWRLKRNSSELYIETGLKINLSVLQLTPLKLHFQDQGGLRLEKCL